MPVATSAKLFARRLQGEQPQGANRQSPPNGLLPGTIVPGNGCKPSRRSPPYPSRFNHLNSSGVSFTSNPLNAMLVSSSDRGPISGNVGNG